MANEEANLTEEERKKLSEKSSNRWSLFESLAELAVTSAKMLVMAECESQGLDDKIEDAITYNKIVADLSAMYLTNTFIFTDRYKRKMNFVDAATKANDKALDIIKKNIQMLMED